MNSLHCLAACPELVHSHPTLRKLLCTGAARTLPNEEGNVYFTWQMFLNMMTRSSS